MNFKRILTGVLVFIMITGMSAASVSADGKITDFHLYAAQLDKWAYNGNDLGANYTSNSTTFKVWAPTADEVTLDLYDKGSEAEGSKSIKTKDMTLDEKTGVWSASISGDLSGKYYTYSVTYGDETKVTGDVYAKGCGVNGLRSMVVNPAAVNPPNWENDNHVYVAQQTNASVWEISVADFSSSETSGVSEANRGKFLAFTESGTTIDGIQGGTPTCVDYLKKLGVKYVQIMPMYDFGSVDESKDIMKQYNWGYDPVNYNCPEGSYSTNPYDGNTRIKECKQMIQALHNAGIGVVMDVVYNHTFSTDSWFQYTVPNYYYRINPDGSFSNGSGCSNDTASEHLMFRKYMVDSVTYWAKEYHIDGFRFDLMGLHDVTTMNAIREALDKLYEDGSGQKILMYGEAWNMDTFAAPNTVMANQNNLKQLNARIGAFDDTLRDGIKGSTFGGGVGFVQNGSSRSSIKTGFLGQSDSSTGWASAPTQCVSYASCHDNLALYDKLVDSVYNNGKYRDRDENLVAMNKLSAAIVMTSQGIPFFLGGEEFARSKDGDENSYASSREENMLDWKSIEKYSDLIEYYRGLLRIRENFAALSDCTAMTANNIESLENMPSGVCAYKIHNTESGKWKLMTVIFNGGSDAQNINLEDEWIQIANEETAGLRDLGTVSGNINVKPHSAAILIDKTSYENSSIEEYEGLLVVNYYDNKTKEKIRTQMVSDEVGKTYNVADIASSLNYDIKSSSGDTSGEFTKQIRRADVYVEEFEGKLSTITIKYVDDINGSELADSYVIRNRQGQPYFTPKLPDIENYTLVLDQLPNNGAGISPGGDVTVEYKYTRITDDTDKSICKVNIVYMADTGKILDTNTLEGKEGEHYRANDNEYEDMNLIELPDNCDGVFKKGEINVLYRYTSRPNPYAGMLVGVGITAGVIFALCIASFIYSSYKRKQKLMARMDIVE
ncbi:type I pullulanase [Ruminococcus sp. JL13D9]|uniref:type I pullulanase n=1 Tax=Ruminococcus sp. JL13D9 TaxID=3233381 RepID=UPI00389A22F5